MCPTRELASQVMAAIKSIISDKINIKTALAYWWRGYAKTT